MVLTKLQRSFSVSGDPGRAWTAFRKAIQLLSPEGSSKIIQCENSIDLGTDISLMVPDRAKGSSGFCLELEMGLAGLRCSRAANQRARRPGDACTSFLGFAPYLETFENTENEAFHVCVSATPAGL
jgi:hypothetical protein